MSAAMPRTLWISGVPRLVIVLTLALQAAVTGAQAADVQRTCTVDAMAGSKAEVAVNGQWKPIGQGEAVPVDARIRTARDTRLHLTCDDGISVTVGAGSEIALIGLVGAAGPENSIDLQLYSGITGVEAPKHTWGKFEVATDVAIASVRSTEWLVQRNADGTSAVFTRRGRVEVLAGGVTSSVGVGEGVTVAANAVPGPVKKWGAPKIAMAGQALGFDWK